MSRYEVTTHYPAGVSCIVGWDNPLQTYFAQVERVMSDPDSEPDFMLWIGCSASECLDTAQLADAIAPWASLPADIAEKLELERDTSHSPTRTQALVYNAMNQRSA
ncbi:hypothetical protein FBY14_12444 [Azospirillum brasilense]|nr:hypothetical protein FBY14_12444 [Azospirillum brasilense]